MKSLCVILVFSCIIGPLISGPLDFCSRDHHINLCSTVASEEGHVSIFCRSSKG